MASTAFALLSLTDKSGSEVFARELCQLGFKILSTGGTAAHLRSFDIEVIDVAELTGGEECLSGRVKTLQQRIFQGILFDRDNCEHVVERERLNFPAIDLICVNLYDFNGQAREKRLSAAEAIEFIDIGGPSLLRAAAKNWQHCLAVCSPDDYPSVIAALRENRLTSDVRLDLARKVFATTSRYDGMIAEYLGRTDDVDPAARASQVDVRLDLESSLRYGENPHQTADYFRVTSGLSSSGTPMVAVQGKALSFNNLLDVDSAARIVHGLLPDPGVVVVKHNNPCGVASGSDSLSRLTEQARDCDPKSAFGGIFAFNRPVDSTTAATICAGFAECVVAPAFDEAALEIFAEKPNLRVVPLPQIGDGHPLETHQLRTVLGGVLVQQEDQLATDDPRRWRVTSRRLPDERAWLDLVFAMRVGAFAKSNCITIAKDRVLLGIGAGQTSRIDALGQALRKCEEFGRSCRGAVMASDGFFPFDDCVRMAGAAGIQAIVHPGGSKRDEDSIRAADDLDIALVSTGVRHFRH